MPIEKIIPLPEETIIRLQQKDDARHPAVADEELGCPWEVASYGCCADIGCCGQ